MRRAALLLIGLAACGGDDITPPAGGAVAVRLDADSIALPLDGTRQLAAVRLDADSQPVNGGVILWRSGDATIADVDGDGTVIAGRPGRTWIEASDTRHTDTTWVRTYSRFHGIQAGFGVTCALAGAGRALCWGRGDFGSLGNGTYEDHALPAVVLGVPRFARLSVGAASACGIANAALWCWGYNGVGQLADGTVANHATAIRVADTLQLSTITMGAGTTICAIEPGAFPAPRPVSGPRASGALCWGYNLYGQLLNGGGLNARHPLRIDAGRALYLLAPGGHHVCALDAAGSAWCWGRNDTGQLGDSTTGSSLAPRPVAGGHVFSSLVSGIMHTCGITTAGEAWCWGDNSVGQLGVAGPAASSVPVHAAPGTSFDALSTTAYHVCGLSSGTAWCWGGNSDAETGTGVASVKTLPAPIPGRTFFSISAGWGHTCGIQDDGLAYCWGQNTYGQLGIPGPQRELTPVEVRTQ